MNAATRPRRAYGGRLKTNNELHRGAENIIQIKGRGGWKEEETRDSDTGKNLERDSECRPDCSGRRAGGGSAFDKLRRVERAHRLPWRPTREQPVVALEFGSSDRSRSPCRLSHRIKNFLFIF
ncbi:hypothetical protein J6590_059722 [Homalodisca vitripennis]|nr:hypothetical protein J6590_059722 [Homalodisca vitripennis]